MKDLKHLHNTKIKVTPEESERIQKYLFENGWGWYKNNKTIEHTRRGYLYIYSNGKLGWGDSKNYFKKSTHKEITISDIFPEEINLIPGAVYNIVADNDGRWILKVDIVNNNVIRIVGGIRNSKVFYPKCAWRYLEAVKTYTLASDEDKQWLEECIKANKFIEKEEALKPTECGGLGEVKIEKSFEFNRWYKHKDFPKYLGFITEKNYYGFNTNGEWFYEDKPTKNYYLHTLIASDKEVEERLLAYAKKKYPIGCSVDCLHNDRIDIIGNDFKYYNFTKRIDVNSEKGLTYVFDKGKWADIAELQKEEESMFKVGDVVYLDRYYKHGSESRDWAKHANLPLNHPLIITKVNKEDFRGIGYVEFEDYRFRHPTPKFKKIKSKIILGHCYSEATTWSGFTPKNTSVDSFRESQNSIKKSKRIELVTNFDENNIENKENNTIFIDLNLIKKNKILKLE